MSADIEGDGGNTTSPERISLDAGDWASPPEEGTFDQAASLTIARWILIIFSGVYTMSFVVGLIAVFRTDAESEQILEFARFMLTSIVPLVTLAVGYYLGDKSSRSA